MLNENLKVLEDDLYAIKGFISEEFIKLIRNEKHRGKIDVSHPDFKNSAQSLIFADPEAKKKQR